jgi:hypothetical protein
MLMNSEGLSMSSEIQHSAVIPKASDYQQKGHLHLIAELDKGI